MRFSIRHVTEYRYSQPVRFGDHLLRLTPQGQALRVLTHDLAIDPVPATLQLVRDAWDNAAVTISFTGEADHLLLESRFEVETANERPSAREDLPTLPWRSGFCQVEPEYLAPDIEDQTVQAFATGLAAECGWRPEIFVARLNETLFTRTDRQLRFDGAAHTPAHTLATGVGACRDLTLLFMAACRSLGIPARFVSGYQAQAESVDGQRHLHAWPEVFLPGAGWLGYDPTHGLAVTDGHVPLCAGPDQSATMPVEGGFYGEGVTSDLSYAISIKTSG